MVAEVIGIVGQPTSGAMPGLRPSRTGVLAFLFLVGGRRLRQSARRFLQSLKLDHQLNQLVLAKALQISAVHAHIDSGLDSLARGRGIGAWSRSARRRWRWVIAEGLASLAIFKALCSTWYDLPDIGVGRDAQRPGKLPPLYGFSHDEETPERTAFVRFRRQLVAHGLDRGLFEAIGGDFDAEGASVRKGTLVDATVIGSAAEAIERRLGQAPHAAPAHGYKAHIAADKDSGLIQKAETTPANEADVTIAPLIIPDAPGKVYTDHAYDAMSVEKAILTTGGTPQLLRKGIAGCPPKGSKRTTAPCVRSAPGWRKSSEPGNAATASETCDDLGSQGQTPGPCRRQCLRCQTLFAPPIGLRATLDRLLFGNTRAHGGFPNW